MTATQADPREDVVAVQGYAARFGALLRRHRRSQGVRLSHLVAASAGTATAAELRAVERGRTRLDVARLEQLAALYGLEVADVVPDRRAVIVDLEHGRLRVGEDVVTLPDTADPSAHLERYVRLVNKLRARPMRSPATLREDDTVALAEAFELEPDEVVELLAAAIGQDAALRRRLTVLRGGGGTLAAVVVLGGAAGATIGSEGAGDTATPTDEPAATTSAGPSDDSEAETGDADLAGLEPVELAPSSTVAGPNLEPRDLPPAGEDAENPAGSLDASSTADTSGPDGAAAPTDPESAPATGSATEPTPSAGDGADGEPEDSTVVDAPGGPTVIEGEEGDEAGDPDAVDTVDETEIDAPGGPVVIEREGDDAVDEGEVDETAVDASGGPTVIEREE